LYHYKGKESNSFYWEKENKEIFELPKYHKDNSEMNFHDDLEYLTNDCPNVKNATKLVSYSIISMTDLIKNYNNCNLMPFPHVRFGVLLGYGLNKLESSTINLNSVADDNFKYQGNLIPGFFIDIPIEMSDFSINTSLYFTKCGYSYNYNYVDKDMLEKNTSFVANTTSINLPVLIRYTFPFMNVRPFLNAGLIYALNIKNSGGIYTSLIYPTYIESLINDASSHITKNQLGFSVGSGMEFKLNFKQSVFIELRYNKFYSLPSYNNLNKSEFQLITALNI
jgi:opacity protein-like surface antigen